jgi:hypothetical protein
LICDNLNVAKHICYDMEEAVKGKLWKVDIERVLSLIKMCD